MNQNFVRNVEIAEAANDLADALDNLAAAALTVAHATKRLEAIYPAVGATNAATGRDQTAGWSPDQPTNQREPE